MKKLLAILVLGLLTININCGGGGGTSTSGAGRTTVTINLGETRTASRAGEGLLGASSTIPSVVASIRFVISAPDMATIERVVSVAGKTALSESFDIPNGANRDCVVEAMDALGNIVFRGETFANFDGRSVTLIIIMVSTDKTPPTFSGISSIDSITTTSMTLSWSAATDNVTPQENIQYLIYMSTTPGGENFSMPSFTTTPGVTSFNVTGLNPDTVYYFVVRAMDEAGNIDSNAVEMSARTLAPPDVTPPTFGGLVSATATSSTSIDLQWNPASDNRSAPSAIVYLVYMSATSGGQNFAVPSFTTTAGATSFSVPGLTPNTTYYFVVRARDEAGNMDTNIVEKSAKTPIPPDTLPPAFGGLVSATAISTTVITLQWNSASDDVTLPANIVYLVYMSTTSGGENFAVPSFTTTAGATSFSVTGLSPDTTYYFVVRAKDEAGNMDTNIVEKSAKTLIPPDTSRPAFGGLVSATAISPTVIVLQWNSASDDVTLPANIVYLVYMSTTSGGENLSVPNFTTLPGVTSFSVTGLSSGTTFYFIVRAKDAAGNIDTNTVEKSATTPSLLADLQPISPSAGCAGEGPCDVSCDVINNGTVDAVSVDVWIQYTDGFSTVCDPFSISVVLAGGTQSVIDSPTYLTPTEYRIMVDPNKAIPESNESNNCVSNNPTWCSSPPPGDCSGV